MVCLYQNETQYSKTVGTDGNCAEKEGEFKIMRKMTGVMMSLALAAACVSGTALTAAAEDFDASTEISVFSREDGSGTRGAFIELFGIEQKDADGNKVDMTTEEAAITNSTSVMMTSVANDEYAIGYISLGSLNDTVKAVAVDGAVPSVDTVKDGSYKVVRPFNIVVMEDTLTPVDQDFINFILSADGQAVVAENGYIALDAEDAFTSDLSEGKIVVGGSSSVSPVMEKLVEAYQAINTKAEIEIQTTDSSTGVSSAVDGTYNIGMASRELKDTETELGATAVKIANDGIAVIVNNGNPIEEITSEQVLGIYTGEIYTWEELEQ